MYLAHRITVEKLKIVVEVIHVVLDVLFHSTLKRSGYVYTSKSVETCPRCT